MKIRTVLRASCTILRIWTTLDAPIAASLFGFRAKIARNNERRTPRNPLAPLAAAAATLTCELNTIH